MPQKIVKGADGKDYIVLPGGAQFPADELKEPQLSTGGKIASQAYKLLTPEVLSGAAALLGPETGGLSMAIPSAVGAGSSLVRDYMSGQHDFKTMASDALLHGTLGMAPGAVGGLVKGGMAMGRAGGAALDAAGALPKVGRFAKALSALTSGGTTVAPTVTGPAADLVGATLPFGEKVLSPEGLKYMIDESGKLALKGKAFGDPQYDKLQQLISIVRDHLDQGPSGVSLAQKAYIPIQTAAQQAVAKGAKYGKNIANTLRGLLGAGSVAVEEGKP